MVLKRRVLPFVIQLLLVFFLILGLLPVSSQALGQVSAGNNPVLASVPDIGNENNTIYIGLHLIDIYSFEYKAGHYTYDMYVYFFWTDPNITTADWYLMNGYPTYPGAKLLVEENKIGNVRWELYRVRANLNTPIEPTNYPFDRIKLPISIELLTHNSNISLVWLNRETGIDSGFTLIGWSRPVYELKTSVSHYPLGMDSPRADMDIIMDRNPFGAFMKTIFPPLIFCFVAAVCFLFRMHDGSAFTLRVGIITSMLVSAVLFNFAEQSDIPPVTQLTLFNVFMAATISFLALGLIVTVLGYVEWMRSNDKNHVEWINRIGFMISVAVPVLFFVALFFAR